MNCGFDRKAHWLMRIVVAASIAASFSVHTALCDVITSSPDLPPTVGFYGTNGGAHAEYLGGGIVLTNIAHTPQTGGSNMQNGSDNIETFPSKATGDVSVGGGPFVPIILTGPVSVEVFNYMPGDLGTFSTQMLSMDLTGTVGGHSVEIMLDPSIPTTGQATIAANGGGEFRISSFFDVFTELSLDHGPFTPQTNPPTHVTLQTPEPVAGTIWMAFLGGTAALCVIRGRHSRRQALNAA